MAERGFQSTAADIRRCRQELLSTPLRTLAQSHDFFSISECRDLLFHVEEHRASIPQIKTFLETQGLRFLAFELPRSAREAYRAAHSVDIAMTDLDRWHRFEMAHPQTFLGMYQFYCQRA